MRCVKQGGQGWQPGALALSSRLFPRLDSVLRVPERPAPEPHDHPDPGVSLRTPRRKDFESALLIFRAHFCDFVLTALLFSNRWQPRPFKALEISACRIKL